jgi:hypothetical protein
MLHRQQLLHRCHLSLWLVRWKRLQLLQNGFQDSLATIQDVSRKSCYNPAVDERTAALCQLACDHLHRERLARLLSRCSQAVKQLASVIRTHSHDHGPVITTNTCTTGCGLTRRSRLGDATPRIRSATQMCYQRCTRHQQVMASVIRSHTVYELQRSLNAQKERKNATRCKSTSHTVPMHTMLSICCHLVAYLSSASSDACSFSLNTQTAASGESGVPDLRHACNVSMRFNNGLMLYPYACVMRLCVPGCASFVHQMHRTWTEHPVLWYCACRYIPHAPGAAHTRP